MEKVRTEPVDEWFYPCNVRYMGRILEAPDIAKQKFEELKSTWHNNNPQGPERTLVCLSPVISKEREGYVVRTTVVYKPSL